VVSNSNYRSIQYICKDYIILVIYRRDYYSSWYSSPDVKNRLYINIKKLITFKIIEFRKSLLNYFMLMFTEIKTHFTHNFSADLNVLSRNLPCKRMHNIYNLCEERVTLVIRFYGFIIYIQLYLSIILCT